MSPHTRKNIHKIRDVHKTIDVMLEIADAVNRTSSLENFYKAIHNSLSRILNVDNFFIAIFQPDEDRIVFPYYTDQKDGSLTCIDNISRTASLTARVIKAGKPLMFSRDEMYRYSEQTGLPLVGTPSLIWLGAPLTIKGSVMGVIAVQSYAYERMYEESDLGILNIVAQYIALAIERKKSDEAYKKQRKILEKILETSPIGIALLENRVFKWVNPEMLTLFGYEKKEEFQDASVAMIYESREEFMSAGERIYSGFTHGGRIEIETRLRRKDGSTFPANINISSANPVSPMSWIIATFTDLSGRKQAEEEKIKNEKLQGVIEMAGAVCHELNQPLQAIMGYSDLIMMDHENDAQLIKDLQAIGKQVERIARITSRLASITSYKTVDYPGNRKIVDIWGSSESKQELKKQH
ncbi:FixL [Desulfamplus magnetovallimortis]|uniref:histidine kinase n=1 Tax=Desulfamplus magnetovallimortis TaxID=1246637 RepID=A0A1W1HAV3_9BACT|nr:PAS domain S-box protein [Desulfamplus magnetovallimortis]SLM29624.1 FixL [Desulfamplus magnetovallimortis]